MTYQQVRRRGYRAQPLVIELELVEMSKNKDKVQRVERSILDLRLS